MDIFTKKIHTMNENAFLVLYSGGLDSIVVAHLLHYLGKQITLLHMNYGQRAEAIELELTNKYANFINVPVINMDVQDTFKSILGQLHTSLAAVSRLWDENADGGGEKDAESSMSYIPFRNTLFLTIAGMVAEQLKIPNITFGSNLSETMTYSDNSEPFIRAMDQVVKLGSNAMPLSVKAPLFTLTKTELIKLGAMVGTPYHLSNSCYFPHENGGACGKCGSCLLRMNAFNRVGWKDPSAPLIDPIHYKNDDYFHWGNVVEYKAENTIKNIETVNAWLEKYQVTMEL